MPKLTLLNPRVELNAITKPITDLSDDILQTFDIVILIRSNPKEMIQLNEKCRSFGILYFCADQFGMQSYLFSDLLRHTFVDERKRQGLGGISVVKTERVIDYPSLQTCLNHSFNMPDLNIKGGKRWRKSVHPLYFAITIVWQFYLLHNTYPTEFDSAKLILLKKEILKKIQVDASILDDTLVMYNNLMQEYCSKSKYRIDSLCCHSWWFCSTRNIQGIGKNSSSI
jgi:ubiquitin-like 1-activating enzyme E1 A